MRIAVIGWGSLIWSERTLKVEEGDWKPDGPKLPIEFSRISTDNRLTLVIDPEFDNVETYWKMSTLTNLEEACQNLQEREDTPDVEDIGFIDLEHRVHQIRRPNMFLLGRLSQWGTEKGLDALIWTELEPKFEARTGKEFNLENINEFIRGLSGIELERAREYIEMAPPQTQTRLRKDIMSCF